MIQIQILITIRGGWVNKVINFHDVKDKNWFENTVMILKKKFTFVPAEALEEFYYSDKKMKNTCHITVDDGDKTFYQIIYPVLKKYKIPATLFVSPAACNDQKNFWFQEIREYDKNDLTDIISSFLKIERRLIQNYKVSHILKLLKISEIRGIIDLYKKRFDVSSLECQNMTTDQLIEIDREGLVQLGAHTITHPILSNEDEDDSRKQILESLELLEKMTGHKIKYFAYPNGVPDLDFGQREVDVLRRLDCRLAFSTESRNISKKDDPLKVPRFGISHGSEYFIRAKLFTGSYWDTMKNLRKKSEKKARLELEKILKTANRQF